MVSVPGSEIINNIPTNAKFIKITSIVVSPRQILTDIADSGPAGMGLSSFSWQGDDGMTYMLDQESVKPYCIRPSKWSRLGQWQNVSDVDAMSIAQLGFDRALTVSATYDADEYGIMAVRVAFRY